MSTTPPEGQAQADVPAVEYPSAMPARFHVASVKQARDRAQYTRQQTGHSFILQWFVFGIFSAFILPIYYSVSPNHYWHI